MVLTSMHKYRPRVLVVRARDAAALAWGAPHASFAFTETEFIAVTAYQVTCYYYINISSSAKDYVC